MTTTSSQAGDFSSAALPTGPHPLFPRSGFVQSPADFVGMRSYLSEFDFRYSNRVALGVDDAKRAELAARGISGKRLTYRRPRKVAQSKAS